MTAPSDYESLAALGRELRFGALPHVATIDELVGLATTVLWEPHRQVRELSEETLEIISKGILTEVQLLAEAVDEIGERLDFGEGGLEGDLLDLFRRRDDLEGAHILLRDTSVGETIAMFVDYLDGMATMVVGEISPQVFPSDERLAHVHRVDPLAWWAGPPVPGRT